MDSAVTRVGQEQNNCNVELLHGPFDPDRKLEVVMLRERA